MFRLCVLVVALLWPLGPAAADIPRPLDERATARLVVAAIAEADPDLEVVVGARSASLTVKLPGRKSHFLRLDKLHEDLRAEADGKRRQDMLRAYVADELTMREVASGNRKSAFDQLAAIETDTLIPVLRRVENEESWFLPQHAHQPFAGGMAVVWVQDRDVEIRVQGSAVKFGAGPLLAHSARQAGLDKLDLRKIGIANLEARLDSVTEKRDGRFPTLSLDGRFGSSLMVLDSYWREMARDGQVLTVAVPREDQLIVIADATEAEIAALRQLAGANFTYCDTCRDEALSPDLFRWTDGGWQVLPE